MFKFSLIVATSLVAVTLPITAGASTNASAAAFVCPVKHPVPQAQLSDVPEVIDTEMDRRFQAVMADNKSTNVKGAVHASKRTVAPALMTALAQVTGCAALIDREESCARYFSTDVGAPLSIFMDLEKSHPLRQQFEAAIKTLPVKHERDAAQHCIRLTGK